MSFERESALDPGPARNADVRFLFGGYVVGLVAMAVLAVSFYSLSAPLGALLAAGACIVVARSHPRFGDAARGALFAAVFGFVAILTAVIVGPF